MISRKTLILPVLLFTVAVAGLLDGSRNAYGRELIVGVSMTDYRPFYFEENGQFRGAAAEIVALLASELGHSLTYRRFPWKRVQHNLATGRIDMVVLYFKTEKRARDVYYVEIPHIYESSSLAVRKDSPIAFSGDIGDLAGYSFGNVDGYWHGKTYSENESLTKIEMSSTKDLLATLVRGRIDIAVCNKPVMIGIAEEMGLLDKIHFLEPKIDYAPDYIAFSKASPDAKNLTASFSKALKAFVKTEKYKAILSKYRFEIPSS